MLSTVPVKMRVVVLLALSLVVLVCVASGAVFFLLRGRRAAPTSGLALTYSCPEAVAAADAPSIQARLDDADVWSGVDVIDPSHLRVLLGPGEPADLSLALRPGVLELRPVDEAAMRALVASPLPPGVTSEGGVGDFLVTLHAPDAVTLSQITPPPGERLVLGCDDPEPGCRGYVALASELGNAAVARADASYDDLGGGASVGLTLTAAGAQRFEALTARVVGGRIAIVLDGRALSVPIVRERIAGGRAIISMGGQSALTEARAIAAMLVRGRLGCSAWTLESEDVFRN